ADEEITGKVPVKIHGCILRVVVVVQRFLETASYNIVVGPGGNIKIQVLTHIAADTDPLAKADVFIVVNFIVDQSGTVTDACPGMQIQVTFHKRQRKAKRKVGKGVPV